MILPIGQDAVNDSIADLKLQTLKYATDDELTTPIARETGQNRANCSQKLDKTLAPQRATDATDYACWTSRA